MLQIRSHIEHFMQIYSILALILYSQIDEKSSLTNVF